VAFRAPPDGTATRLDSSIAVAVLRSASSASSVACSHSVSTTGRAGSPFQDVPLIGKRCLVSAELYGLAGASGSRRGWRSTPAPRRRAPSGCPNLRRPELAPLLLETLPALLEILEPHPAVMRGSGYRSVQPMLRALPSCSGSVLRHRREGDARDAIRPRRRSGSKSCERCAGAMDRRSTCGTGR
jgi:hypothetical protein